jgi:hypothetical protein
MIFHSFLLLSIYTYDIDQSTRACGGTPILNAAQTGYNKYTIKKEEQEGILFFSKNKKFDYHIGMNSCKYQIIYNLAIIASPHVST